MKTNGFPVVLSDMPARNGVYHFVSRLINPLRRHRRDHRDGEDGGFDGFDGGYEDEEDWEDWRDWLPQWAEED